MRTKQSTLIKFAFTILLLSQSIIITIGQIVAAGSGSYTKTFPGLDAAGRNQYPSGTPQVSGNAVGKPIPTNDWWSALIKNGTADNLFNLPFTMKTVNSGLVVSYIPFGVINDLLPVTVGVTGMSASKTTVSDYSDWTVTMDWNDGTHNFVATSGIGMPFLYFTKKSTDVAQVKVNSGTVAVANEMLIITNAMNGADFAVYAPVGSTWTNTGGVYTSTLNGKNYWSMAFIPLTATDIASVAAEYKKYAYVFPVNTTANYNYNETTSVLRTDFTVTTDVKEGAETNMLLGILPHQWGHLASNSPLPDKYSYATVRGEMKTLSGNSFSVENTFHGVLPTLPYLDNYSTGFAPTELTTKINSIENDGLATWTDTYNEGQVMNRLIQTARIADEMGNTASRDKMLATIKTRLENWFTASTGEVAFLFFYNTSWTTLIGYPGGYGQDGSLNDHHFHWGYFIHAAAFVEQYQPGWAAQWGDMVNMLVRDAGNSDRNDAMFPYLRNFSPYNGCSWADGFANNPQGNNQESTSESMQFNTSLIHWGEVTGNKATRDLGIYLYTTEQTAIEEYWFDIHERNLPVNHPYSLVSRVWSNSFDNGTFWTGDIAAVYGIEIYPMHGGSLYLGQDTVYVAKLWNEMKANTGIMDNEVNPNLWHDIYWEYLAFIDPAKAIEMYNSNPNREIKFGVSDAQTYHWLHSMNALGRVDATITANYPIASAFKLNGVVTYVAHNCSAAPIEVTFSTGYKLTVPAYQMATSKDISISGELSSSFDQAYPGGSVQLTLATSDGIPSKVVFMDGINELATVSSTPFIHNATNLSLGVHSFYARIYEGENFNVSNGINVIVGSQLPYGGTVWQIPGTIEAGKYDVFESGKGQNITYMDATNQNSGDYRMDEYVDASSTASEGTTVGWIAAGEWLEYTVAVEQSGLYSFAFRYASGNAAGGGPFHIELDGQAVSGDISVPSTSTTKWDVWATKTESGIPLTKGDHILRIAFSGGEFNLAKMTFTRTGDIAYTFPIASAGADVKVLWPISTTMLDGSGSSESGAKALTYNWTQIYGPSVAVFADNMVSKPSITGLLEGMYRFKLTVTNTDLRISEDEVMVVVSSTENILPNISLTAPLNSMSYPEGTQITLSANASDFDGTIQQVEFFQNEILISTITTAPYSILWTNVAGDYVITAKATDNGGATALSKSANVKFLPVLSCTAADDDASQGSFSVGYKYTFETVGTDVTVSFELFDDKAGVEAFLWTESPFTEKSMKNVGGKKFSTTLTNQISGSTLSVACKFAFSGGQSVTKYVQYKVGDNCEADLEAPKDFTAILGEVTASSIELLFNATDNSDKVLYNITLNGVTKTITASSGTAINYVISALTANTTYSFSVTVSDITGNLATNNPIVIAAKTLPSNNTACAGSLAEASQGAFSIGYKYAFTSSGTDVNITFELLDAKTGVAAYLQNTTSAFVETAMTNSSGKVFTTKLTSQKAGSVIKVACKFAYEGGMVVTKVLSYTVGDACNGTSASSASQNILNYYPNPVSEYLTLQLPQADNTVSLFDLNGRKMESLTTHSSVFQINMSKHNAGLYVILIQNTQNNYYIKVVKE